MVKWRCLGGGMGSTTLVILPVNMRLMQPALLSFLLRACDCWAEVIEEMVLS